jgi:hypothetical protein
MKKRRCPNFVIGRRLVSGQSICHTSITTDSHRSTRMGQNAETQSDQAATKGARTALSACFSLNTGGSRTRLSALLKNLPRTRLKWEIALQRRQRSAEFCLLCVPPCSPRLCVWFYYPRSCPLPPSQNHFVIGRRPVSCQSIAGTLIEHDSPRPSTGGARPV